MMVSRPRRPLFGTAKLTGIEKGNRMHRLVVASLTATSLSIGATVVASAADLSRPAPAPVYTKAPTVAPGYNWSGFYLGIEGGGAWADSDQTDTSGNTTGTYKQNGGLVGGTVGYNWQVTNWVFGLEGDASWAHVDGTVAAPNCNGGSCFTNLESFYTARGRLGIAFDQFLPYVTGGLAAGEVNAGQAVCNVGGATFCGTDTRVGWTAGAGVEALFAPHWSAKVEYLYADLGDKTQYTPVIPVDVLERPVNIVRGGINYHF
jgi:outer membrane immunogenic protein